MKRRHFMKSKLNMLLVCLNISLFIMTSCATTTLTHVWKDDGYVGQISNVLVMGVIKQPAKKRFFEDEFVNQLKAQGISAVASYRLFPSDRMIEDEEILAKMNERDIDALETYVPGTVQYAPPYPHRRWHGYYADSYRAVYTPGYSITDEVVIIESNLYDAKSEGLIWSAMSETFVEGSRDSLVKEFIKKIIGSLSEKNLIK
jgi:hypothetical protein